MAYDEDQCIQCGGIRANRSSLCVKCLVDANCNLQLRVEGLEGKLENRNISEGIRTRGKNEEIKVLEHQLKLTRRILKHVYGEYRELRELKVVDIPA